MTALQTPILAEHDPACEDSDSARVVVLVDGSPDTDRALRVALHLCRDTRALLTIAAYAPGSPRTDAPEVERVGRLLIAAQAEAEVEGVAAERFLLHGPDPLAQLRALLSPPPSCDRLVLCAPAAVQGSLRPLSRMIVRTPPCSLYVVPRPAGRIERLRTRAFGWLIGRVIAHEAR